MTHVARAHVSTDASAEEVVQDTWVGFLRGIDTFEGRSSLRTWTFRILTNIAKTRGVRERRMVPQSSASPTVDPERFRGPDDEFPGGWKVFPISWPAPDHSAVEAETAAAIRAEIGRLPERQRAVITLRDVHGFTAQEVCEVLELSPANQRVLLHRARAAVRGVLEDQYAVSPAS
jgi:RNA polymerase sigma-70 factor (ECF subfamily)